ncbi:signal peptide peptidase-like 2A isoform X2 [Varanus komodoensis]|uniref:signal peptide peptidase-like 2A isoform X2 n=1 Tax=Varanus komodoensis TaxID=61221 RepID=UPI001CF7D4E5|nr:signal peptide peptidase-like 2A isoform X2 [Varanus komodoensis]
MHLTTELVAGGREGDFLNSFRSVARVGAAGAPRHSVVQVVLGGAKQKHHSPQDKLPQLAAAKPPRSRQRVQAASCKPPAAPFTRSIWATSAPPENPAQERRIVSAPLGLLSAGQSKRKAWRKPAAKQRGRALGEAGGQARGDRAARRPQPLSKGRPAPSGGGDRTGGSMRAAGALRAAIWGLLLPLVSAQEGILHVFKNSDTQLTKEYCIYYNRNWSTLPSTLNNIVYTKLAFLTPKLLCSQSDVPQADIIKDKAIVVMRGNCTFLEKAEIAQHFHAKMLLIASETPIHIPFGNKNQSINIPIALIRNEDIIDLKQTLGKNVSVALYSPPVPDYFYSVVLIFLIAVLCVILGGYWSGMVELEKLKSAPNSESSTSLSSVENVTLTPVTAVLFVCISCVMLVLMYYFYKWLVYVVISLFCVASATSLFNCLSVLVEKIPYGQCRFPCWHQCIKVRLFFLALFCIAASVTWAVFRNEDSWAWILQDILGIAFCVNLIKTLKVPNFKSCVLLLGLLLLYDVFFVFITPFITKNGESIMVEVATGPSENSEKLPVVIKVPKLIFSGTMLCQMPFSLLGYGDIVLPGLLVAYCHRFDIQTRSSRVYFISCTIAYAVGMLVTFLSLSLMKMAQPALLYLVPCTLLSSTLVALYRKEMKKFWNGNNYQAMDFAASEENPTRASEQHGGQ